MKMPKEKLYTPEEFYSMELPERCELIKGRIYIGESEECYKEGQPIDMSPSPNIRHQEISGSLFTEIFNYIKKHKGKCRVFAAPTDVKIGESTVVPDIFVTCDPSRLDGQKHNGAPDWVIEVLSPSTSKRDTISKVALYREGGAQEYWIVDPDQRQVIVYPFEECEPPRMVSMWYTFEDNIPVSIYKNEPDPLSLRLADNL